MDAVGSRQIPEAHGGAPHGLGYISFEWIFASRASRICDRLRLMPSRQADALGALLYLSKLDLDPNGIAVVGFRRAAGRSQLARRMRRAF